MVMSQIAMELDQKATELGFESLSQAQEAGCEVEWHGNSARLVESLELAHRAWEKEKADVLEGLDIVAHSDAVPFEHKEIVRDAIKFVESCHE